MTDSRNDFPLCADALDSAEAFQQAISRSVRYLLAKQWKYATPQDLLVAVALAVRERLIETHLANEAQHREAGSKRIYYLSMEFLMGRSLSNTLLNLGLYEFVQRALAEMGADLGAIEDAEADAALGNGGLGRLAACFLDSLTTLGVPAYGYGINYDFGLFRQTIVDGQQREQPDAWGKERSPWLIERPFSTCEVPVYGRIIPGSDEDGQYRPIWTDRQKIIGKAQDMPVVGYGGRHVNFLRLFSAKAPFEFDMEIFHAGDYVKAVEEKILTERISKVLYPADDDPAGRELRLLQEYFLVACSLHDILQRFRSQRGSIDRLPEQVAIQMNDTHPALAVAELMRILVDEHGLSWARAWALTRSSLAYTNHTLLPEALETWPVPLLEKVIPRHLQIIFEINRRFLETVTLRFPDDAERLERVSLIHESEPQQVRMAHLAIVGSHSVNGVAKLHSHLLRTRVFPDFHELWPERIHNKTNGVTQRRWMLASNPALAGLLKEAIGDGWITQLEEIAALEAHAGDAGFQQRFAAVKRENKARLAATIGDLTGIRVSADALFDVQAKRIHLYKRQLLHLLFVLHEHCRLLDEGVAPPMPRVHVFAGKAAPGYREAKQVIQLIHRVAEIVHRDVRCRDHLQVVFLPDYRVSLAERIIPAADLSEQVSTAGMEASGTGNMKFAMNGALTMGTLDGANIEILEEVGAEHLFLFGKTADEIAALRARGDYRPEVLCSTDPRIARVMEFLASAVFRRGGSDPCREMHDLLMAPADDYFHLADLGAYIDAQTAADAKYLDQPAWTRSAILNVARMAPFSSDRTVREYLERVWCRAEQPVPA